MSANRPEISLSPQTHNQGNDISLGELAALLFKNKPALLALPLAFAIFALFLLSLQPPVYKAETTILPRQPFQSNAAILLDQVNNLASQSTGTLSVQIPIDPNAKLPTELVTKLLESRSVADEIIARFELQKSYKEPSLEKARDILNSRRSITVAKNTLINITVKDSDSQRAAQIANAHVDALLKLGRELGLTKSSQRRIFLERELQYSKEILARAENHLNNNALYKELDQFDKATIAEAEARALVNARVAAEKIQASTEQQLHGRNEAKINTDLGGRFQNLGDAHTQVPKPYLSTGERVDDDARKIHLLQAFQSLKYEENLQQLLSAQLELARVKETQDISLVTVVDRAIPAEYSVHSDWGFITVLSALIGLLLAVIVILSGGWRKIGGLFSINRP